MGITQTPEKIRPLENAHALDPSWYVDPNIYALERRHILPKHWQVVAPADLVSCSGDIIRRSVGDVPIIILRNVSGELKGFYNICPHRAGPLATCDVRGLKRLRCAYHGWAYTLDGQLKSAPEMKEAEDFDPDKIRLTPIDMAEWGGLIWARAGQGANFEDWISPVADIVGAALNDMTHHKSIVYDVGANWKVYIDNYLEGYHLPFVHPSLTQAVSYADYVTELGAHWSLQRSPVTADNGAYAQGEALYVFVYPNTMLNILPGRLQTNRVVPTGIDSCQVEFDFYYTDTEAHRLEDDTRFSDQVQDEDRLICEHVQTGLASGVYKPGRLSPKRESGVWHWQNLLRRDYESLYE